MTRSHQNNNKRKAVLEPLITQIFNTLATKVHWVLKNLTFSQTFFESVRSTQAQSVLLKLHSDFAEIELLLRYHMTFKSMVTRALYMVRSCIYFLTVSNFAHGFNIMNYLSHTFIVITVIPVKYIMEYIKYSKYSSYMTNTDYMFFLSQNTIYFEEQERSQVVIKL